MRKLRKLKLSALETTVLLKIKKRQVKNIEIPTGIVDIRTGKRITASAVNLPNIEASQFGKLERKGLIAPRKGSAHPYFTSYILTAKGKAQFR